MASKGTLHPPLTKPPSLAGGKGPVHLGLASGFLKGLKAGDTLEVFSNKYVSNGTLTESGKMLTENGMLTESGKMLTENEKVLKVNMKILADYVIMRGICIR